jgi:hypothetical protein
MNPYEINPYEMNPNQMNPYEMNPNQMNPNQMNPYLIDPEITSILLEQEKYINEHKELLWFIIMVTMCLSPFVFLITKICSFHSSI